MNRASLLFLGIFFALAFSFTGLVLTNQISYGKLAPVFDESEGKTFPEPVSGLAAQGKLVYQDLGCAYCHTQQVRRPGFGADTERNWGERQSFAREYVREGRVLLGGQRIGQDLRNVGLRINEATGRDWHIRHLYDPQSVAPGTNMPAYRFLFETRKIVGEPSVKAVQKLLGAEHQPEAGHEIVLTPRGEALVEYLLSLKDTYSYPDETQRVYVAPKQDAKAEAPKAEGHK
jgi:cytochrome c oxidase cbb3-type subunit II